MKTLLITLGAGIAIGYFLASDDKEAFIQDAKDAVNKGKDFLKDTFEKGKTTLAAAKENL